MMPDMTVTDGKILTRLNLWRASVESILAVVRAPPSALHVCAIHQFL